MRPSSLSCPSPLVAPSKVVVGIVAASPDLGLLVSASPMLNVTSLRGRTASYANVAAFEASLHGVVPSAGLSPGPSHP